MRERLVMEARGLLDFCREHGFTLATAESCTGGLVAAYLTHIAGASDIVERGFVTYSNEAKIELLGVDAQIIADYGAVSEKPVGLVHFAIARRVSVSQEQLDFKALHHEEQYGDIGRAEVREAAVETAFRMLRQAATL
jgi:nicotinamide-nucleotide amidase